MKSIAFILLAAVVAHIAGSAALGLVLGGLTGLVGTPLLAFFGRFFLVPEIVASGIQWTIYRPVDRQKRLKFLVVSVLVASPIVAVIGPKEDGSAIRWTIGYALAAACAAVVSGLIVQYVKHRVKKQTPNQALQHNDPSCHVSCVRTPRASRGRG